MGSAVKNVDILSFDGGGSRGVMEVFILNDVLRLATIVLRNPWTLNYLVKESNDESKVNFLENRAVRKRLINDLKAVKDPIHPADIYDMIVGTSTGGLVAFGLIGGKRVGKDHHERERMSVDECIQMYLTKTKLIFKKSWMQFFLSFFPILSSIPFETYSQANVKKVLTDQFGDCNLEDFHKINGSKCVAGAVARKLGSKQKLELFDTASEDYELYKTYQVLLATSNVPVYFNTPVHIGNEDFVDGGVGGNCPLAQAIPRAMKLFGKGGERVRVTSALSIAPPSYSESEIPESLSNWLHYFVNKTIDGNAIFKNVVKNNRKTSFQRLSPRGESLKKFQLDEIDVRKMLTAMENEKVQNHMFLVDVVASAMFVVLTFVGKGKYCEKTSLKFAAKLAEAVGHAYQSKKEYDSAISSYFTSTRLCGKLSSDFTMVKTSYNIAKCWKALGKYQRAIDLFKSNVKYLVRKQDDPKSDALLVDSLIDLADSYITTFSYAEAKNYLNEVLKNDITEKKGYVHVLTYIAWCEQQLGKLEEAVNLYKKAAKFTINNDNFDNAKICNNVGLCFLSLGMKEKASYFVLRAKDMRVRLSEQKYDPLVAESFNNVGLCLIEYGEYDKAYNNLIKAKNIYHELGNELKISMVLRNLAICLSLKHPGNHNRAMDYAQQSLDNMGRNVGDNNSEIAKILSTIGLCLFKAGRFEEAKEHLLKAADMIEHLLSENHPWLVEVYKLLSTISVKDGDMMNAESYKGKMISIDEEIAIMARNVEETFKLTWKNNPTSA